MQSIRLVLVKYRHCSKARKGSAPSHVTRYITIAWILPELGCLSHNKALLSVLSGKLIQCFVPGQQNSGQSEGPRVRRAQT